MTMAREALRGELASRGYAVASDTVSLRGELYVLGDGDRAAAIFEFKVTAQEAAETMYEGRWTSDLPPRFAVLPARERAAPESSFLEQAGLSVLFFAEEGQDILFPALGDALDRIGRPVGGHQNRQEDHVAERNNAGAPRLATIPARPEPLQIDLARTAVIVVDMQNAFLSPGGMFDEAGYDISKAPECTVNNARLLPSLRAAGVKVVYLMMSYAEDYSDSGGPGSPNYHKELGLCLMQAKPEKWGKYVTEGTWDEQVVEEIAPQPGDIVVRKQRYSGFAGTNLDMILKTHGIRYCLYTGVATNVCVETTLREGFLLDYWPILVADACNNSGPEYNRLATEWNVEHAFGWVTTVDEVSAAIAGQTGREKP